MGFMDGFSFWLGKMAAEALVVGGLFVLIFAIGAVVVWFVDRR